MKSGRIFVSGILLALIVPLAFAHDRNLSDPYIAYTPEPSPTLSAEKSGTIPTKPGLCLRLTADPGDVRVFTDESSQVSYHVDMEADSRDPGAAEFLSQFVLAARRVPDGVSLDGKLPWRKFNGQFRVTFEVHVPRQFCLKIDTQGGDIEVQDISGPVDLVTGGGNIRAGRIDGQPVREVDPAHHATQIAAHLETQGGHITIGDVSGTLHAETSGGHITTGNIEGDGMLRTGGGQIQTGRIVGAATLETGGGNIRVASAGSSVTANTAGGQIDLGDVAGSIHAQTGGGALHIERVAGPTDVEIAGGSIFLNRMDAPLQLSSTDAGMTVYLPRQLATSVDAVIQRGGGHSIIADSSLPLTISYQDSGSGIHTIRGEGDLNGGGEALHLKARAGNIILKLAEPRGRRNAALRDARSSPEIDPPGMQAWNSDEETAGLFEDLRRRILESWWGGIPVDADEMQKHLEHSVAPAYPDVARKAGVEGDVVLRVYVSSDGRVSALKVLEGAPILARAAVQAVQQWQYQTLVVDGRPVDVVTTLTVAFRLK